MPDFPSTDQLLAFLLRFVQDGTHRLPAVKVPDENKADYLSLFGLVQRVRRLTHAYLRLRHEGMAPEGRVLARAALEHAVTAQWAYLTPGGVNRLNVSLAQAQRDLADHVRQFDFASGGEWNGAYEQIVDTMPSGKALPPFHGKEGIIAELDNVKFLGLTYKLLSQTAHVSHDAATGHVMEVEGRIVLRMEPEDDLDRPVLYSLAGFGLLASWIQARMEGDEAEVRTLEEFGRQLHVPHRLDEHLTSKRRRFDER